MKTKYPRYREFMVTHNNPTLEAPLGHLVWIKDDDDGWKLLKYVKFVDAAAASAPVAYDDDKTDEVVSAKANVTSGTYAPAGAAYAAATATYYGYIIVQGIAIDVPTDGGSIAANDKVHMSDTGPNFTVEEAIHTADGNATSYNLVPVFGRAMVAEADSTVDVFIELGHTA